VPYLRIAHLHRECLIEQAEAESLARELWRLGEDVNPSAVSAAVIIVGALKAKISGPITFTRAEGDAVLGVLEAMLAEQKRISESLYCLRDALLIHAGNI
jgi:hypothetical protein